jgi:hypothetical protein
VVIELLADFETKPTLLAVLVAVIAGTRIPPSEASAFNSAIPSPAFTGASGEEVPTGVAAEEIDTGIKAKP